jgi:transglutaminase-like putative cysteine protease
MLDAHRDHAQNIRFETPFETTPAISTETYIDTFGNSVRRFVAPPGDLTICRDTFLEDSGRPGPVKLDAEEVAVERLPNDTLVFTLGSRYCETDKLSDIAWQLFGSTPRGWRRVQAICDFVCDHLTFGYQYARPTRTAYEAYQERLGVCRDFAHLAVTFCRCMNIPARYANGFLGDIGIPPDPAPMDYNAWFEVFLDGRWFYFRRAPQHAPHRTHHCLARPRETDIPLATSFGPHILKTFRVWTEEVEPGVLAGLTRRSA